MLAIVITIMVLELKQPVGDSFKDLLQIWPTLMAYILSFMFVATYWVNHHLLFQKVECINLKILWCNIAWLFVMLLIPFTTSWVGSHPTGKAPLSIYFADMALAAITFHLMYFLIAKERDQKLTFRVGFRNYASLAAYILVAVLSAFFPIAAYIIVGAITIWWIFPQRKKKRA